LIRKRKHTVSECHSTLSKLRLEATGVLSMSDSYAMQHVAALTAALAAARGKIATYSTLTPVVARIYYFASNECLSAGLWKYEDTNITQQRKTKLDITASVAGAKQ
jgi:hypothetical protein